MNVGIKGIGTYIPEKIMTNHDFEKFLDTSDEWISKMTGIKERRFAAADEETSDMAFIAAEKAIADAGIDKDEIDMIIVATATGDHKFPAVANQLQERLGLRNIPSMDQLAACTGFIYSIVTAQQFVLTGMCRNILVIGAEKLSKIANMEDRNTAILFGDGAGAVIIGEVSPGHGILSSLLGSDGSGGKYLYDRKEDQLLVMNGREVFKFAVRIMGEMATEVVAKAGLKPEDVDMFIPHQANIRIMEASRERLGIPREKMSVTIDKYGNTSAASIPLSMMYELEQGKIKEGSNLVLVGFGGGLTYGAITLVWGK
ncbi:beta-ketoacyl-ACP synthase III [Macrococcus equipercicus]|uniref:Beta-ketoacyl-[acyl-carrier-protein] synthase III n=1 Tax=Macrococcus equipercicus TaxID=69967 RepID=A0A9Q9F1U1_9STAP|nr:beta-ketoacyl-ACP synthase III [Macrococcus equipercicus]KAA1042583.1 ketoacyl-ACP synthase III [Macrococcus equipercicus]UTH14443.1 ketoacyl-ACP synthase III [Macrococcus equipercicus]